MVNITVIRSEDAIPLQALVRGGVVGDGGGGAHRQRARAALVVRERRAAPVIAATDASAGTWSTRRHARSRGETGGRGEPGEHRVVGTVNRTAKCDAYRRPAAAEAEVDADGFDGVSSVTLEDLSCFGVGADVGGNPHIAEVLGMWVDPAGRGQGLADVLAGQGHCMGHRSGLPTDALAPHRRQRSRRGVLRPDRFRSHWAYRGARRDALVEVEMEMDCPARLS